MKARTYGPVELDEELDVAGETLSGVAFGGDIQGRSFT